MARGLFMIPRISLLLKQSEASMSDWKLFLHENEHKKIKNPDTGRDVKLQSLKGEKGKELLQKLFDDWKKGHEKSDEPSAVGENVYAKLTVTCNTGLTVDGIVGELNTALKSNLKTEHLFDMMGIDHFIRTNLDKPHSHSVSVTTSDDTIVVDYKGPHVQYMQRRFYRDSQSDTEYPKLIVYNEILRLNDDAPQGLGTKLLAHQVSQALKHNVSKIKCEAAGDKDSAWVGYKVWPKLGYDGELREFEVVAIVGKSGDNTLLPKLKALKKAENRINSSGFYRVSDFYKIEGGTKIWEEYGSDFNAEFDLSEGSHSRRVLEAYIAKKAEKDGKAPSDWIKSALIRIALHLKQSDDTDTSLKQFLKEHSKVRVVNPESGNRVMLVSLKHTEKGAKLLDKLYQEWLRTKNPEAVKPEEPITPEAEKQKRHESYKDIPVTLKHYSDTVSKETFSKSETLSALNKALKTDIQIEDIYDMIGLDHLMTTHSKKPSVHVRMLRGNIEVKVFHPHVEDMSRIIQVDNGEVTLKNQSLHLKDDAPKGLGTKLLYSQMKHASMHGVSKITCWAAHPDEDDDDEYVGYKVWPKLGYDADLSKMEEDLSDAYVDIPPKYASCKKISDLYQMEGGEAWWAHNGIGFHATFDLAEGSLSRKILTEYIAKKAEKEKKTPQEWIKSAMAKIAYRLKQSDTDYRTFMKENEHITVRSPDTGNDVKLVSLSRTDKGQELLSKMFHSWLESHKGSKEPEDSIYNKISVEVVTRGNRFDNVCSYMSEKAGHPITKEHLMDMVGADYLIDKHHDPHMKIKLKPLLGDATIEVTITDHKHIKGMQRSIAIDDNGALIIINDSLSLHDDAPKGLGTKLLANQVAQAKKHGVERIECDAARDATDYYIGYKVWPKLGYDGYVPNASKIPSRLLMALNKRSDKVKVSDLYRVEGGQEWWEKYGDSFDAEFDLLPGSESEKVLAAYVKAKAEKDGKTPDQWIKTAMATNPPTKTPKPTDPKKKAEEIPWDDIDHDVLDQVWKDLRTNKKP